MNKFVIDKQVPEGYRQTEIGIIPEDWNVVLLRSISSFSNGKAHEMCISEIGEYIVVNSKFISTSGKVVKKSNMCYSPLFKDHIALVMSDIPNGKALAKCFVIPKDNLYTLNQRICSIFSEKVNNNFLAKILNRNKYFLAFDSKTGQTNMKKQDILSCPLAIPPTVEEQEAIAGALSDVDGVIGGLERLIAKKRLIKQGAMQELLTGKMRLAGFGEGKGYKQSELGAIPEDWCCKQFKEVLTIKHGKSQHDIICENGKYPILATGGEIGRSNSYLYNKESVLIGRKGTIDVPYYMDTPFWTVDTLFYSEINGNAIPKFLYYKFCLIDWYLYNEASGVPSLNANVIEKITESFPPSNEEQSAISSILEDMDSEISKLVMKLDKYKKIKEGMMQNLLTGKIRLVKPKERA